MKFFHALGPNCVMLIFGLDPARHLNVSFKKSFCGFKNSFSMVVSLILLHQNN